MQEKIEILRSLEGILAQKFTVEDEIKEIPQLLEAQQEVLNSINKEYLELHNASEEAAEALKELNERLQQAIAQREDLEKQLSVTSTLREYEATEKERKDTEANEQFLRKKLIAKEKDMAEISRELEEKESLMKAQQETVALATQDRDSRMNDKVAVLNELNSQRAELTKTLDNDLVFKFERIIRNKDGKGIVPIHGLVCQGCHMTLPVQFVNTVRKNEEIEFCPYCSRILYYDEAYSDMKDKYLKRPETSVIEEGGLADFASDEGFEDFN